MDLNFTSFNQMKQLQRSDKMLSGLCDILPTELVPKGTYFVTVS